MTGPRILVVGGTGVFGSRLVEGLAATLAAEVWVAGRNSARAAVEARRLGAAGGLMLDRRTATADEIARTRATIVIDAAGPFQGGELSFARAVIAAGSHYIDLADARDFVAAFQELDAAAKATGVCAMTGASSTPALTHAALDELTAGWTRIDRVCAGISPGNRAPRGRSVVEAILSWAGGPVRVFERGVWTTRAGWSGAGSRRIEGLGRRRFALAETPDLDLMASRMRVTDEALFLAGLELGVLHHGLAFIALLRRAGIARDLRPLAGPLTRVAGWFDRFGSDRGGMFVEAWGRDAAGQAVRAQWTLTAPEGRGPFVPTLPALAMARRMLGAKPEAGAGPCVGVLTLADMAADFARLGIETRIERERLRGAFELALGADLNRAPPAVRDSHRAGPVSNWSGEAQVAGATGLAALPALAFGFPGRAAAAPAHVRKTSTGDGHETWERRIGTARFRSRIAHARPGFVTERFGPFSFELAVACGPDRLTMDIASWRIGPIPLPRRLAPKSLATEAATPDGEFTFDVPIAAPLLGRLAHYKGVLRPVRPPETEP